MADRIRKRLAELGKTANGASVETGGSASTIPNILNGRSESPRGKTLTKIAAVLGVTEAWLLNGDESTSPIPNAVPAPDVTLPAASTLAKDMPVLGTAAGSDISKGAFQLTTDVIDYVRRPPGLAGAKDAYALYVEGDSMSPRYEHGELIFIHPHRKVAVGDYIVIQEPDRDREETRAFIKRLVKLTGTTLKVEQFNPPAQLDFVLRPGLIWHKVVTDSDLYGF